MSKCYGAIQRFSEDIDLSLDPEECGFFSSSEMEANIEEMHRSHRDKIRKDIEGKACSYCETRITPVLEEEVCKILPVSGSPYFHFQVDGKGPVISFNYPTVLTEEELSFTDKYVKQEVKIELGSLVRHEPVEDKRVTPWIFEDGGEKVLKKFPLTSVLVKTLGIERTFWEKVLIIHLYNKRKTDAVRTRERSFRDFYDVCQIFEDSWKQRVLNGRNIFRLVCRFNSMFYPRGWIDYDALNFRDLQLVPDNLKLNDLQQDYQKMKGFFYGKPPDFDKTMEGIKAIQNELRDLQQF